MAKKFLGTFLEKPIIKDPEADITEAKKSAALMSRKELVRYLRKMWCLDCIMMLNNGDPSVSAPYPGCYHPYDSDGLSDLDKLVDIDGNPVPFPRKKRRRKR